MDELQRLQHIRDFAAWLDEAVEIPVLNYKVGWEAIIGLVPGIGDFFGLASGLYIIYHATKLGVKTSDIMNMLFNVVIEAVIGSIPVLGDAFDFVWKANKKNIKIIENHIAMPTHYTVYEAAVH